MIRRKANGEYEFRLRSPSSHEVVLVGDFGGYRQAESQTPMARSPSGDWICHLDLSDGAYRFKYWVDGGWRLDEDDCVTSVASVLTSTMLVHHDESQSYAYVG
jgi:hypothetical protein